MTAEALCYLCGKPMVEGEATNVDHIPPKQMLVKEVRRRHQVQWETRRVHEACNYSFKLDEEYFVQTLVPYVKGTEAGDALYAKTIREFHQGKNVSLVERVKSQAVQKIGSIHLPASIMALDLERDRIDRVISKIVRGLHYCETGAILDPDVRMFTSMTLPTMKPPEHFETFMTVYPTEDQGHHKGVFAYRHFTEAEGPNYWAMLLWDRVLLTAMFRLGEEAIDE